MFMTFRKLVWYPSIDNLLIITLMFRIAEAIEVYYVYQTELILTISIHDIEAPISYIE